MAKQAGLPRNTARPVEPRLRAYDPLPPQYRRIPAFRLELMSGRNGVPAGLFAIDFIAANSSFSGAAEQAQQPAFACTGEIIARGISNRAIDGRTFILDDGREVHLAAIEVPPLSSAAGTEPQGAATRDALAGLLAGRRSRAPASRATKNGSLRTHRGVCV